MTHDDEDAAERFTDALAGALDKAIQQRDEAQAAADRLRAAIAAHITAWDDDDESDEEEWARRVASTRDALRTLAQPTEGAAVRVSKDRAEQTQRECRAAVSALIAERDAERQRHDRETRSIHADMLALGRLLGVPYDGASSPAGYLHGDLMPAVERLRREAEGLRVTARENKWYAEKHAEQATAAEAERDALREALRAAKVALVAYVTEEHPWLDADHCFRCEALHAIHAAGAQPTEGQERE